MKKYSKKYYINNGQFGDRLALSMYYRIFKRYVNAGGKVLEFGAGNGHLSKRLARRYKSDALEISDFAKKNIRINSPKTRLIKNESFIKRNYYDGIISLHTLEHIKDPEKCIFSLTKGIKKNGVFFAVVPNLNGLGKKIKGKNWFGYRDKTHISLLSSNKWKRLLNENNMTIVKTGGDWFWDTPYFSFLPNFVQKIFFYPGCLLMVLLGEILYPEMFGECLVLVAVKN